MVSREYLYRMFGPFWNQVWQEPSLVETATAAFREAYNRLEGDRSRIQDNLNRFAIPLSFYRHFNYRLVREHELGQGYRPLGTFNLGEGARLGELQDFPPVWTLAMAQPTHVELLLDKPVQPTVIWQRGQEFDYADGFIHFYKNPFEAGFLSDVTSTDGVLARTCKFWMCDTKFDVRSVKDFFGVYFGVQTPTTEYYKRLVNIIWDLALEGATIRHTTAFLCALADTDVALEDGKVEAVWTENGRVYVATPNHLHSAPDVASAIVSPDDIVEMGQNLFDSVTILKGSDTIPSADFPMLHLGREFISARYEGGILLQNRSFLLTNSRFQVGGLPATVDAWWDDVEADMAARGADLWATETSGQRYPYQLNPFDFIRQHVLKTNSLFITMNRLAVPDPETNFKFLNYLLDYMPAATTFFMYIGAVLDDEPLSSLNMVDSDGEGYQVLESLETDQPGLADTVGAKHKLW